MHFASWWGRCPLIISSLVCSSKEGTTSLVMALSDTPVLSGVTGLTPFPLLLQGKQTVSSHCLYCICDFDSGDCSFTVLKKKSQYPKHFLSLVSLLKIRSLWGKKHIPHHTALTTSPTAPLSSFSHPQSSHPPPQIGRASCRERV